MALGSNATTQRHTAYRALVSLVCAALMGAAACNDRDLDVAPPGAPRLETTRLCALVPARDAGAAAFPPTPPVKVFGTDLGWTYEARGRIPILFGDTWQRIDICPLQVNDDSLGTLRLPENDWPGYTAPDSILDSQCPVIDYEIDGAGTAFAPITLERWDGVEIPLGPLNTPVTGFFDGETEWAIFIVGGGQACSTAEAASAAACSTELSPQAADLVCATAQGQPRCVDPTSTRQGDGAQAYALHIAERVGASAYVSRAVFLTNKYLNLTTRTVRAFTPADPNAHDFATGHGALLVWGRPGFDDLSGDGASPPYFLSHPLPFRRIGERIRFEPSYWTGFDGGSPVFGARQSDAVPLYPSAEEFEPVNHSAVSWIASQRRWLMIYGGSSVDYTDPQRRSGRGQLVPGALYARVARAPWGPWSEATPVLTPEQTAEDLACGHLEPPGCLESPDPRIRPACIEAVDAGGGGSLYGANIIDALTREHPGGGVDVFWNYSTWHPYSVVLARTRVVAD